MAVDLNNFLVVGISSRALFDLEKENDIFQKKGLKEYENYQLANEKKVLEPGTGFPLAKAILRLNDEIGKDRKAEVVITTAFRGEPFLVLRDAAVSRCLRSRGHLDQTLF